MRAMAGRFGFGLRMQIVVALSVALLLAFALLSVVAFRLAERSRDRARTRDAIATAEALAAGLSEGPITEERFAHLTSEVIGHGGIRGIELRAGSVPPMVRGVVGLGSPIDAEIGPGRRLRLWVRAYDSA